jgi:hypothetical protein
LPPTDRVAPTEARADFAAVDRRLREVLEPYRSRLVATTDGPDGLALEIPGLEGKPWGYVAGIRRGKRYVSFYLMSVYGRPQLLDGISPELRRRMQGKACFNFTKVDEPLFAELARLTEAGFEDYLRAADQADVGLRCLKPTLLFGADTKGTGAGQT